VLLNSRLPFHGSRQINYLVLLLCFLLVSFYGFFFSANGTAHAATKDDTGWVLLYNGKPAPRVSPQKSPLDPPENNCIDVHLTLTNPQLQTIRAEMGFFNNCGKTLTKVYWNVTTTLVCGPGVFQGPHRSGGPLIVTAPVSPYDEEGTVTCLHDNVPQPWTAQGTASVSDAVASASGSANASVAGR